MQRECPGAMEQRTDCLKALWHRQARSIDCRQTFCDLCQGWGAAEERNPSTQILMIPSGCMTPDGPGERGTVPLVTPVSGAKVHTHPPPVVVAQGSPSPGLGWGAALQV